MGTVGICPNPFLKKIIQIHIASQYTFCKPSWNMVRQIFNLPQWLLLRNYLRQFFYFLVPTGKKSAKKTFRIDITKVSILRCVLNTFWTKNSKSSHCVMRDNQFWVEIRFLFPANFKITPTGQNSSTMRNIVAYFGSNVRHTFHAWNNSDFKEGVKKQKRSIREERIW